MRTIAVDQVIVAPERQRKIFDEDSIRQLAADIAKPHGLLHPIVLENDGLTLVAGERRLRATGYLKNSGIRFTHMGEEVPLGHVPFLTLGQLSLDSLQEAQLSENVHRQQLSWQEVVSARAALLELRTTQGKTVVEVAAEIKRIEPEEVKSHDVAYFVKTPKVLAEHLHVPEVRNAASQDAAYKALARHMELDLRTMLGGRAQASSADRHKCYHGDFRHELVRVCEPGSFDCIVTDPPYGVDADKFSSQSDLEHSYKDDAKTALELYSDLASLGYKYCRADAHLYAFCDLRHWWAIARIFEHHQWQVCPFPIIWDKGNQGIAPNVTWLPRRTHETILFARKGGKQTTGLYPSIITGIKSVDLKTHAAQKPAELYVELLRRSCLMGERVLDPFAGSGTIFAAAERLSLSAVGIEVNKAYYEIASETMLTAMKEI